MDGLNFPEMLASRLRQPEEAAALIGKGLSLAPHGPPLHYNIAAAFRGLVRCGRAL